MAHPSHQVSTCKYFSFTSENDGFKCTLLRSAGPGQTRKGGVSGPSKCDVPDLQPIGPSYDILPGTKTSLSDSELDLRSLRELLLSSDGPPTVSMVAIQSPDPLNGLLKKRTPWNAHPKMVIPESEEGSNERVIRCIGEPPYKKRAFLHRAVLFRYITTLKPSCTCPDDVATPCMMGTKAADSGADMNSALYPQVDVSWPANDPPANGPASVEFADTDSAAYSIGGLVTIHKADNEVDIDYYHLFAGTPEQPREILLAEVTSGGSNLTIELPQGVDWYPRLAFSVYPGNGAGIASSQGVTVAVTDVRLVGEEEDGETIMYKLIDGRTARADMIMILTVNL
eukprot:GHVU01223550.1.p1 GENE.GHVU01223550.1~~GHVU01223550.1.p1  ORF type:complete len:340 (+),score=22.01 GHVU01223550.1:1775-2794(+)